MIVRIRFGAGTPFTRPAGRNGRLATAGAVLMTMAAVSFGILAAWRVMIDLGIFSEDFAFSSGLFSHWQVWLAAAIAAQWTGLRLNAYARRSAQPPA
jgi:hypothetical protein